MRTRTALILFFFFVNLASSTYAMSIGVSPTQVIVDHLLRGSVYEKTVQLSRDDGSQPVRLIVDVTGDMTPWLNLGNTSNLMFSEGQKKIIFPIKFTVPNDTPNGIYKENIRVRTEPSRLENIGALGASVSSGVSVDIHAKVIGEQVIDFTIPQLQVPNTEEGEPITVVLTVDNKGNVRAGPSKTHVEILNKYGRELLISRDLTTGLTVPPFTRGDIPFLIPHKLSPEEYTARIQVYNGTEVIKQDTIMFNVLEKGSIQKEGVLEAIQVKHQAESGEVIKIVVPFKNIGSIAVLPKLIVEVYYGDILLHVLESEPVAIAPGETANLEVYFTPDRDGLYIIKGYAVFAGKRTETMTATVRVGKSGPVKVAVGSALLLVMGLIIMIWYKRKKTRSTQ